jgi:hypothetical protein
MKHLRDVHFSQSISGGPTPVKTQYEYLLASSICYVYFVALHMELLEQIVAFR